MSGRPKMCKACGKLMGVARVCPYCGADSGKVAVRVKAAARRPADGSNATATKILIGTNLFLFALVAAVGGLGGPTGGFEIAAPDNLVNFRFGMMWPPAVADGDWWRLFLAVFLHGGVIHVAFNSYIGWTAGKHMEADIGPRLMFLVYMSAGVLGFVASYYFHPGTPTLGASGAVAGQMGFLIVRRRLIDGNFRHPLTVWVIQLTVLNALFGMAASGINNSAHLGGFVAGAGFGWLLTSVNLGRNGAMAMFLANVALAMATVAALIMMVISLMQGGPDDVIAGDRCRVQAQQAVISETKLSIAKAESALRCLAKAQANLGGDSAEALGDIRSGLQIALDAFEGGDQLGTTAGLEAMLDGASAWNRWLNKNHRRYMLGP